MRWRSLKLAAENRKRRKMLAKKYPNPTLCERCGMNLATDPHELKPRSAGGSITDPNNVRMLCRPCHEWVHNHPLAAYREGWLIHSWMPIEDGIDYDHLDRITNRPFPGPQPTPEEWEQIKKERAQPTEEDAGSSGEAEAIGIMLEARAQEESLSTRLMDKPEPAEEEK